MNNYSAIAAEYVADDPHAFDNLPDIEFNSLDAAVDRLVELVSRRIRSVTSAHTKPVGLMLSGGIDSILVAAVASHIGADPMCVTVVSSNGHHDDESRAAAVAEHLGFDHHVVRLTAEDMREQTRRCVECLDTPELWEITSAVPVAAAFDWLSRHGIGPVLTGAGADAIFMGGEHLEYDPNTQEGRTEFVDRVTAKVRKNFTRHRLIPDYYERLLDDEAWNFIQIFQTDSFYQFAVSVDPSLLWRVGKGGRTYDKYTLRNAAARLGVPDELVWTQKAPLQVSSGMISGLVTAARADLASDSVERTYSDPNTESVEHTAARLYLRDIYQRRHQ